jgi:hypothetical protein
MKEDNKKRNTLRSPSSHPLLFHWGFILAKHNWKGIAGWPADGIHTLNHLYENQLRKHGDRVG